MDLISLTCAGMLCNVGFPGSDLVSRHPHQYTVQAEIRCVAENIHMEARGEPDLGKIATVAVVLNRMRSPNWPNSACQVVYQPHQFSWTHHDAPEPTAYELNFARRSIMAILDGYDPTNGATFYHTTDTHPRWDAAYTQTRTIGRHTFLK